MRHLRLSLFLLVCLLCFGQPALPQPPGRRGNLKQVIARLEHDSTVTLERSGVTVTLTPFEFSGHTIEALVVQPIDSGHYPGLLLVPGYMITAKDYLPMAAGLAREGFTCMAVTQMGWGSSTGPPDFAGPATVASLDIALNLLKKSAMVDSTRLGALGYSRGAMAVGMLATTRPDLKAVVLGGGIYDLEQAYEELEMEGIKKNIELETGASQEAFRARSLVFAADQIICPVLIVHGGQDTNAPVAQAYLLRDKLQELEKTFEIQIFPGSPAWSQPGRVSHKEPGVLPNTPGRMTARRRGV